MSRYTSEQLNKMDGMIFELFTERWCGEAVTENIDTMRSQLHKSLRDQTAGYWSGHTAYWIMVDGGFLEDAKYVNRRPKILTDLGQKFMEEFRVKS